MGRTGSTDGVMRACWRSAYLATEGPGIEGIHGADRNGFAGRREPVNVGSGSGHSLRSRVSSRATQLCKVTSFSSKEEVHLTIGSLCMLECHYVFELAQAATNPEYQVHKY